MKIKDKEKSRAAGDSEQQPTECTPHRYFRCGSIDDLIANYPKPPKDMKKRQKQFRFNERGNHTPKTISDNDDDDNNQ